MTNTYVAKALIAFGSNLGNVDENIKQALAKLNEVKGVQIIKISSVIKTTPVGGPSDQPIFSNGAVLVKTTLLPLDLLHELQRIEKELLRIRKIFWGPRTIDLDLILFDDVVMSTEELTLPHPRVYWRSFVLDPANEISPEMIVPTSGITIKHTRALLLVTFQTFALASYYYRALADCVSLGGNGHN